MNKNDLRAVIAQEVSRAQIFEAMKSLATEEITADHIIKEYTSLIQQLSEESNISLKEANQIVGNALKNGGKVELEESSNVVISEGFFSRLGGFYRDVFKAAANAFDPRVAQELPKPEEVAKQAKGAEQGGEQTMDQLLQQLKALLAQADAASEGDPEKEKAQDELIASVEDEVEEIDDETGEEGEGGGSDVPLSILKKNPATKDLGSSGAKEMPLNAFLMKQMKFGAKASNKIAQNLAKQLKAQGIAVSEARIIELYKEALVEAYMAEAPQRPQAGTSAQRKKRMKSAKGRAAAARGKADAARAAVADAPDDPMAPGFARRAAEKDAAAAEKGAEDAEANVGRVGGDIASRRGADKAKRKEMEKRAKGHKMGAVAQTILTHAARSGSRAGQFDEEFLTALGDDPKMQDKAIGQVVKMLRRQMQRRGMDDATIKKALRLKEAQIAEMVLRKLEEQYLRLKESRK